MSTLVVIPTLNEAHHLARVMAELCDDVTEPIRVVVADGGSTDGTPELARSLGAELIENPRRLQAAGVNLAVSRATQDEDVLVRADAHCSYPRGFVDEVTAALRSRRREGCVSVVVPMVTTGRGRRQRAIAATQNSVLGNGGSLHRRGGSSRWIDHGHHAAMDIAAFLAVGGYDETMPANEDAELDLRLVEAGHRLWFDGDAAIVYHPRSTFTALASQYRRYGAGRARTLLRHREVPKLRQVAPVVVTALNVTALAVAPRHPVTLTVPAAYLAGVSGVAVVLASRMSDAQLLLVAPAAVVQHHAWGLGFIEGAMQWLRTVPARPAAPPRNHPPV